MVLASIISGAGATQQMDGWHACGPLCCFGALSSGDIELLEYQYPILIHKYGLAQDSGGAGRYRGGSGTVWEVEPLGHEMTVIAFGEGRQIPTMGAADAEVKLLPKLVDNCNNRVDAFTEIRARSGKKYEVAYQLYKVGSTYKVYNIKVDGASLVTIYRNQFNELIKQKGIDGTIATIKAKGLKKVDAVK